MPSDSTDLEARREALARDIAAARGCTEDEAQSLMEYAMANLHLTAQNFGHVLIACASAHAAVVANRARMGRRR